MVKAQVVSNTNLINVLAQQEVGKVQYQIQTDMDLKKASADAIITNVTASSDSQVYTIHNIFACP